jgi:hypothetical protein
MAKIKKKEPIAKKKTQSLKNARKKIGVRIINQKKPSLIMPESEIIEKKKIVEKEIFDAFHSIKTEPRMEIMNTQPDDPQLEKSKKIIMWSGVTFFMVLIGSIWIYIAANNINEGVNSANKNGSSAELKDGLSKSVQEFKDSMEIFKELKNSIASTTATGTAPDISSSTDATNTPPAEISSTSPADTTQKFLQASLPRATAISSSTPENKVNENNELAELKKKLDELERKLQEIK